jgi:hypothetical protein
MSHQSRQPVINSLLNVIQLSQIHGDSEIRRLKDYQR